MVAIPVWSEPEENWRAKTSENNGSGHQDANASAPKVKFGKVAQGMGFHQARLSFVVLLKLCYCSPGADERYRAWEQQQG